MAIEERDPVTGRMTTGHEWNGIEELETPIPKVVLLFLATTVLFSIVYWLLMPAWPLGVSYTRGLLGMDQRDVVTKQVEQAAVARAQWTDRISSATFEEVRADPALMQYVKDTGRTLFEDNCAVCHGVKATGGPGFPDLTAKSWLWGGDLEAIEETIAVGINSTNDDTRVSQMMAFGRGGILDREQIRNVVAYVQSLSAKGVASQLDPARVEAGKDVFAENCTACHGEEAKGGYDAGAPDLTDSHWIYGGDAQSIFTSVYSGRQGHMPHWSDRLSPVEVKTLALYVYGLEAGSR